MWSSDPPAYGERDTIKMFYGGIGAVSQLLFRPAEFWKQMAKPRAFGKGTYDMLLRVNAVTGMLIESMQKRALAQIRLKRHAGRAG